MQLWSIVIDYKSMHQSIKAQFFTCRKSIQVFFPTVKEPYLEVTDDELCLAKNCICSDSKIGSKQCTYFHPHDLYQHYSYQWMKGHLSSNKMYIGVKSYESIALSSSSLRWFCCKTWSFKITRLVNLWETREVLWVIKWSVKKICHQYC